MTTDTGGQQPRMKLALVLPFYGAFVAAAFLWSALAGRPRLVYQPGLASPSRALLGAGIAFAGGMVSVGLSRLLLERTRWARELFDWFAALLGPLSRRDVLLFALLSSVGEELLFRGAIQPSLGLYPTTLIFALLHFPPRRELWPWSLFAGVLGLGLGALSRWSGDLGGAVIAHFTVNALNLGAVAGRARTLQKLPGPDPTPSMGLDPPAESCPSHAPSDHPSNPAAARDRDPDPDERGG
jgi:membrane protease YdiL (CAAX protease family)